MQTTAIAPAVSSLFVDGFRGLRGIRLEELRNFVVVVGPNGTGKTSLLEAVIFARSYGFAHVLTSLQAQRGLNRFRPTNGPGLDYTFEPGGAEFALGSQGQQTWLKVGYRPLPAPIDPENALGGQPDDVVGSLEIRATVGDRSAEWTEIWDPRAGRFIVQRPTWLEPLPSNLVHPAGLAPSGVEVQRFADLVAKGMKSQFVRALQLVHPGIRDVDYVEHYRIPGFMVTMDDGTVLPLGMLGGGLTRWAVILMQTHTFAGQWVGMDEPENGIHPSVMPKVIRHLVEWSLADQPTQVMVATHSDELLDALVGCEDMLGDNLSVIQMRRRGGKIVAHHVAGVKAFLLLRSPFDAR